MAKLNKLDCRDTAPLKEVQEGEKQIYVGLEYFPQEYLETEVTDYFLDTEDEDEEDEVERDEDEDEDENEEEEE